MKLKNLTFGSYIKNKHAGDLNPHQYGYFVEHVTIKGAVNNGQYLRLTDKMGAFWLVTNDELDIEVV